MRLRLGMDAEPRATDQRMLATHDDHVEASVRAIAEEFRMGFETVNRLDRPAVTVFGSARIRPHDPVTPRSLGVDPLGS